MGGNCGGNLDGPLPFNARSFSRIRGAKQLRDSMQPRCLLTRYVGSKRETGGRPSLNSPLSLSLFEGLIKKELPGLCDTVNSGERSYFANQTGHGERGRIDQLTEFSENIQASQCLLHDIRVAELWDFCTFIPLVPVPAAYDRTTRPFIITIECIMDDLRVTHFRSTGFRPIHRAGF